MMVSILKSILWMDLVVDIWNDVWNRFLQGITFAFPPRLKKGNMTMSKYFTRLKILWEELEIMLMDLMPSITCVFFLIVQYEWESGTPLLISSNEIDKVLMNIVVDK